MAKVKLAMGASVVKGKLNGSVFQGSPYGLIMTTKANPINPQSKFTQPFRSVFQSFSKNWRALSQVQRDAWIDAAPFPLSGYEWYVKYNALIVPAAGSFVVLPNEWTLTNRTIIDAVVQGGINGTIFVTFSDSINPSLLQQQLYWQGVQVVQRTINEVALYNCQPEYYVSPFMDKLFAYRPRNLTFFGTGTYFTSISYSAVDVTNKVHYSSNIFPVQFSI